MGINLDQNWIIDWLRGGRAGWGNGGESWGRVTASRKASRKKWSECDGGYELVGSGGACDAGSMDVEGSHHSSNPILDGKMQMLNKNDDDDDNKKLIYFSYNEMSLWIEWRKKYVLMWMRDLGTSMVNSII